MAKIVEIKGLNIVIRNLVKAKGTIAAGVGSNRGRARAGTMGLEHSHRFDV